MTTAPGTLVVLQKRLETIGMVNLGIVGDASHVATGGYHIGAATLRANGMGNDYSLQYALDRNATHDYACAFDIGGIPSRQMIVGNRLVHALKARDKRVYGKVRGVNAPFDGMTDDRRLDDEDPNTSADDNVQSSSDRGHIHVEVYRTLVTNQAVIDGIWEVLAGLGSSTPTPTAPKPPPAGAKIYQASPVPALIAKGTNRYFGLITGPANSLGGATPDEHRYVTMIQRRLIACGFVPGVTSTSSPWADGRFEQATADAVSRFQHAKMPGTTWFGQVWYDDWTKLFNL